MKVRDLIAGLEALACPDAEVMFGINGRGEPIVMEGGASGSIYDNPVVVLTHGSMLDEGGF